MGLHELVSSPQLMKVWLEELPHTTVLDVGKSDLAEETLRGHYYHQIVVDKIRALENNARDLLSTPGEALYWRRHMDLYHRYIVVAPGMVSGAGTALQKLAIHEDTLFANKIMICSAYRHIYHCPGRDPWTMSPEENTTLNLAIHEAIWRLHCPGRAAVEYSSREKLENFAHANILFKPHYFCIYKPILEAEEGGGGT